VGALAGEAVRVSNSKTLAWTGAAMGSSNIELTFADSGYRGDVNTAVADYSTVTHRLFDNAALQHAWAYGKGAESRAEFPCVTSDRAGIIIPNLQTIRAAIDPSRAVVNAAAERRLAKAAAARAKPAPVMSLSDVAYESDVCVA
jgi:hypothetical protein